MQRESAYRDYISECMRMMSGNTAKFAGGEYMTIRLDNILHPQPKITIPDKSAEEIAFDITASLGLKIKPKGGE